MTLLRHLFFSSLIAVAMTIGFLGFRAAAADTAVPPSLLLDAGSAAGSGSATVVTTTTATTVVASQLPDPLEHPAAAADSVENARKTSWPLAAFAILVMLTKGLAYAAIALQGMPVIGAAAKWLAVGKRAVIVAGIGTLAMAGYNTLATGGTWIALVVALGVAGAGVMHSTTLAKPADPIPPSPPATPPPSGGNVAG